MKIEVVTYNFDSVRIAAQAGADRVELCANERAGGVSPSVGLLKAIKEELSIPVFCMLRPREGDFVYTPDEINIMLKEIDLFKEAGADGIVSGVMTKGGEVDIPLLQLLVKATSPLPFTYHRAFDYLINPLDALEQIIDCGCTRILTSGQQKSAEEGISLIAELIDKAGERIIILPGAGVNPDNAMKIANATGCVELHLSAKKMIPFASALPANILLGTDHSPMAYQITDERVLKEVIQLFN